MKQVFEDILEYILFILIPVLMFIGIIIMIIKLCF